METTPFELNSNAFPTKSNITLYTSKYYLSQYQTANVWSTFKIIKSYPDADVNCDKNVDVVDVIDIVRYTRGSASSSFDKLLADLNSDKEIDVVVTRSGVVTIIIYNTYGCGTRAGTTNPERYRVSACW